MQSITQETVSHLSRLARLELTNEESSRFATQLSSVVQYIEQLSEVDTSSILQVKGVSGMTNVFSEDTLRSDSDQCQVTKADLFAGVPAHDEDYIHVRAVMTDEIVGA